jgi:hypothetical protein
MQHKKKLTSEVGLKIKNLLDDLQEEQEIWED